MTKARDLADLLDASGNIIAQGTIDGRDIASDGSKLDGIETGATGDQTHSEIRSLIVAGVDTNVFTDADHTKLDGIEANATADQTASEIKTSYEGNSNTNAFTDAEQSKLSGVEAGATADQTASEIRALVESATDSNVFTDADHTKLNGIEANATADQTPAQIKAAYENNANTNEFSDAEQSKLAGIEAGATGDQTASEIRTLVEAATDSNVFTDADHSKLNAVEANAKDDQTITAGSGLTGGGTGDVTLNHADTSSVSNANNSGNTFIQDINFDGFGHVTSVGTGTVSVGNGTLTVQGTGALGGSGTFTANQSGNSTISISHDDTSSQGSVNNSGATVVQDVTLDGYGHVTGLGSHTLTLANLGYTGATNANYITNNNQLTNGNNFVTSSSFKTVGGLTIIGSGDIPTGVSPPNWTPTTTPDITYTSSATWSRPSSPPTWIIVLMVGGGGYSSYYPGYGWGQAGTGGAAVAFSGYGSLFPTSLSFVVGAGGQGESATNTRVDAGATYTTVNGTYMEAKAGQSIGFSSSDSYRFDVANTGGGMGVPFGGTPGRYWSSLNTDSGQGGGDVQRPENNAVVGGGGGGGRGVNTAGGLSTYSGNGGDGRSDNTTPSNGATHGGGAGASNGGYADGGVGSVRIWYVNQGIIVVTKIFYNSENGQPAVVDDDANISDWPAFQETPLPKVVTEEDIRFLRGLALETSDWMALQDRTMTQAERDYRQELRDLTTTTAFVEGRFNDILIPPPPAS